jgi:hypothetical protein
MWDSHPGCHKLTHVIAPPSIVMPELMQPNGTINNGLILANRVTCRSSGLHRKECDGGRPTPLLCRGPVGVHGGGGTVPRL